MELDTHAGDFLLNLREGALRPNVVHYRTLAAAASALKGGEIAAVMGTRSELEAALGAHAGVAIDTLAMPELRLTGWPLGMAVKADSSQLAEALSGALADLQRSGELSRIFEANGVRHRVP